MDVWELEKLEKSEVTEVKEICMADGAPVL